MTGNGRNLVWTRSALVLLRYPRLFAALAVGALLLSLALASVPLFLSASASELVRGAIAEPLVTRYRAGISYKTTKDPIFDAGGIPSPTFRRRSRAFADLASRSPYLGPTESAILGGILEVSSVERTRFRTLGRLFTGTNAPAKVEVLAGHEGPGVWLPDLIADNVRARPGDTIALQLAGGSSVEVAVDGIYRGLYFQPRQGYWLSWDPEIYPPPSCATCPAPPQFMLADLDEFLDLSARLGATTAAFAWQAPLAGGARLTLEEARELGAFYRGVRLELTRGRTELAGLFPCCDIDPRAERDTTLTSFIPQVVDQVDRRLAVVRDPTRLLQVAAVFVAVGVLAGAGAFGVAARRSEVRLLVARGMGPLGLGTRGALEAAIPCAAGCVIGLGTALLLIQLWGPGGRVAPPALWGAALAAAAALPASLAPVGMMSGLASGSTHEQRGARIAARLPWEAGLLALALVAYDRIASGRGVVLDPALRIRRPTGYLLLFSVALVGGAALLAARLFRAGFRRMRTTGARPSPSRYLAFRRLGVAGDLAMLLLAAVGLSLGSFFQAGTVVRSVATTVDAKAKVFVGSDYQASVPGGTAVPPSFPLPATMVARLPTGATLDPGNREVDLLAIDPSNFARAAFWDDAFADRPLREILDLLRPAVGRTLPVVLAGGEGLSPHRIVVRSGVIPIRVVARPSAFPGLVSGRPLVVVDRHAIREVAPSDPLPQSEVLSELWIRGDPVRAADALAELGVVPIQVVTVDEVKAIPYIEAVVDTYLVLDALALVAALLVVVALLMYLQARQRSQLVAYGLSRRMGMSSGAYRRSLLLELALMLAAALVVAAAAGVAAAFLIVPRLDPFPKVPPRPLVDVPILLLAVTAALLALTSWLGAVFTERRSRGTALGEVLRVAE